MKINSLKTAYLPFSCWCFLCFSLELVAVFSVYGIVSIHKIHFNCFFSEQLWTYGFAFLCNAQSNAIWFVYFARCRRRAECALVFASFTGANLSKWQHWTHLLCVAMRFVTQSICKCNMPFVDAVGGFWGRYPFFCFWWRIENAANRSESSRDSFNCWMIQW